MATEALSESSRRTAQGPTFVCQPPNHTKDKTIVTCDIIVCTISSGLTWYRITRITLYVDYNRCDIYGTCRINIGIDMRIEQKNHLHVNRYKSGA